jgi:hypothetical protein
MLNFGRRSRFVEDRYSATDGNTTTIVKHERDPMSGWIMAFMVMVVLVGLGFMSLMDLSSQQSKTERALFELQQEFRKSHIAANTTDDLSSDSRTDVYSRLNQNSEVADGTMVDDVSTADATVQGDELAAPFPIVPSTVDSKVDKAVQPAPVVPNSADEAVRPVPGVDPPLK